MQLCRSLTNLSNDHSLEGMNDVQSLSAPPRLSEPVVLTSSPISTASIPVSGYMYVEVTRRTVKPFTSGEPSVAIAPASASMLPTQWRKLYCSLQLTTESIAGTDNLVWGLDLYASDKLTRLLYSAHLHNISVPTMIKNVQLLTAQPQEVCGVAQGVAGTASTPHMSKPAHPHCCTLQLQARFGVMVHGLIDGRIAHSRCPSHIW